MAFIRKEEKKGISLPGLIDIIFLLLIFSLATFSFSESWNKEQEGGKGAVDFDLPEAKAMETFEPEEVLQTLMFQIEHMDPQDLTSPKAVYILWSSWEDSLTIEEARRHAERDSLFAVFPPDFLTLSDQDFSQTSPCTLIHWALRTYKNDYFLEPKHSNTVEIRAVRDTEFRIINFIMEQCSAYGDTIPRFMIRTISEEEVDGGI